MESQLLLAFVGNAVRMGQTAFKVPSMDASDGEQYAEADPQLESAEETRTGEETTPCLQQHDTVEAKAEADAGEPAGGCSEAQGEQGEQEEQAATESSWTAVATSAAGLEPATSKLQRRPCARPDSAASETSAATD